MDIDYDALWQKPLLTKAEAIELLDSFDHSIIKKEGAEKICQPFDYKPKLYRIQDTRSQFKGAYFADLKEGEWAEDVIDAADLATDLCKHLKVDYIDAEGRGRRLHQACDALRAAVK